MTGGEAVTAERLPDLPLDQISRFVQPHGAQFGNHSLGFPGSCFPALLSMDRFFVVLFHRQPPTSLVVVRFVGLVVNYKCGIGGWLIGSASKVVE